LVGCTTAPKTTAPTVESGSDPFLWLEDIESSEALKWVREHNDKSLSRLKKSPLYSEIETNVKKILLAGDRLPWPGLANGWVYNFWQDEQHVKGIWRRVPFRYYAMPNPPWEIVLDLDALAKSESENWVWKGANCLRPKYEKCLLHLSRGGKDAVVAREFDLATKSFVRDGFALDEAKIDVSWVDPNFLLVGTDFGPNTVTLAGYPRVIKLWKRGTPLSEAKLVMEGEKTDVGVSSTAFHRAEGTVTVLTRSLTFFEQQNFLLSPDGKLVEIPLPRSAQIQGVFQGYVIARLRDDWTIGAQRWTAGSLVSLPLEKLNEKKLASVIETLFVPGPKHALQGVVTAKSYLYLTVLNNVRGELHKVGRTANGWHVDKMAFPELGSLNVLTAESFDDRLFIKYESFLEPASIYEYDASTGGEPQLIRRLPQRFDSRNLVAEQWEATSADGTKIPYFIVRSKLMPFDGTNPTVISAYGGFQLSSLPHYLEAHGKVWLESGGVYVLANIRGGGEFGPRWHQAALRENRQKAFDDLAAVVRDLVKRRVTNPKAMGIRGGSNGGLLVGTVFVQNPDLFGAVVCSVPLLDMLRYHKLLAGSSWVAEYGDPENPEMAKILGKYSPYQNVIADVKYPKVFFITSTKDDRVHPGHARKMVARMESQEHKVLYYENIEGGHGAAANLEQRAMNLSLEYTYLFQQLGRVFPKKEPVEIVE